MIKELITPNAIAINPAYLKAAIPSIQENMKQHAIISYPDKKGNLYAFGFSAEGNPSGMSTPSEYQSEHLDEPFIDIVYLDSAISRSGAACTISSKEARNRMMEAADNENCQGHILYIDSPGGIAWCINDFKQSIDYVHGKNQKVIAYIDGDCASLAMWIAAMCDEIYYMNANNQIGCIGVMAAFFTQKDGEKNQYTAETYHELYDPESFDKNKEVRDVVNGDNAELLSDLTEKGVEFRTDIQTHRPNVTDEHIHGKTFNAKDVEGILVDGQKTLSETISRLLELNQVPNDPKNNTQSPSTTKGTRYQKLAAFLGMKNIVGDEQGTFLNAPLIDSLLEKISKDSKTKSVHVASKDSDLIAELNSKISDLKARLEAMEQSPGEEVQGRNQPSTNGYNGNIQVFSTITPPYDPNLSPTENAKLRKRKNN